MGSNMPALVVRSPATGSQHPVRSILLTRARALVTHYPPIGALGCVVYQLRDVARNTTFDERV
jgi:hypothetical protein